MKHVHKKTVTYSSDLSGVCSALYELGGLIVMHDASGCNSTYATHDEPRWYDMDSMIYISGLTEYDAVLGNDDKLIDDILEAALEMKPRFIAIMGAPVALMIGTDFRGIARIIEKRSGIPCLWFNTSGMESYTSGIEMAYRKLAERQADIIGPVTRCPEAGHVNLIGMTPLDYSVVGNREALLELFAGAGYTVDSIWAMGSSLEDMREGLSKACLNVVISSGGLAAARSLEASSGIPYAAGVPAGGESWRALQDAMKAVLQDGKSRLAESASSVTSPGPLTGQRILIVGEAAVSSAIRYQLEQSLGADSVQILCPLEIGSEFLRGSDIHSREEEDLLAAVSDLDILIADPLYRRVLPRNCPAVLWPLPQEAYSGRMYRSRIPVIIGEHLDQWIRETGGMGK